MEICFQIPLSDDTPLSPVEFLKLIKYSFCGCKFSFKTNNTAVTVPSLHASFYVSVNDVQKRD